MKQPKEILKTYFETGDKPTEQQFCDLIDSYHHQDNGLVVTSISSNDDGDQQISFSNGSSVLVQSPNRINQNNKIRVIDLGVLNTGSIEGEPIGSFSRSEESVADLPSPLRPTRTSFVEVLLIRAINNLNPPLVIAEDENVIFEFDILTDIGFPDSSLRDQNLLKAQQ